MCNDIVATRRTERPTRGLGQVTAVYTGGRESLIWEGLRAALPEGSSILVESDGTIRYTNRGLDGSEPPSPPEGFQVVDEWTFRCVWPACRGRAFTARVCEGVLRISAACIEPAAGTFGSAVTCGQCRGCPRRKPIEVRLPGRRVISLPPLPTAAHSSRPETHGTA